MSRILDHIAELSPEKRALLALRNPLSFAQQRLWFLNRFDPASPLYNVSFGLRLNGRLDRRALHRALLEISRRHEVLRTIFILIDGQPAQVVDPEIELELPLVDLTSLSDAGREAELKRLNLEQRRQPFALASGNVLRAMLCRIKENDHAFLLTMHHIVSDAWSRDILIRELAQLYQAFSTGRQSPLPDLLRRVDGMHVTVRGSDRVLQTEPEVLSTELPEAGEGVAVADAGGAGFWDSRSA